MILTDYEEIVRKHYRELLSREPDPDGFNHYVGMLKKNEISEQQLINIFKNSIEYKLSHPIEIDLNMSVDIRMKKEWDVRTKLDPLFVIATGHSKNDDDFWNSGVIECKQILDMDGQRFSKIIRTNEPSKMKILEIGCGVQFNLNEIHKIAEKNNFEIIEESNFKQEYYWLTFQSKK